MNRQQEHHIIDILFVIALFCIFALSAVLCRVCKVKRLYTCLLSNAMSHILKYGTDRYLSVPYSILIFKLKICIILLSVIIAGLSEIHNVGA